jgi:hypothetical protein
MNKEFIRRLTQIKTKESANQHLFPKLSHNLLAYLRNGHL